MGRTVGFAAAAATVVAKTVAAADLASPGTNGRIGWSGVAKAGDDENGTCEESNAAAADGVLAPSFILSDPGPPKKLSESGIL